MHDLTLNFRLNTPWTFFHIGSEDLSKMVLSASPLFSFLSYWRWSGRGYQLAPALSVLFLSLTPW